MNCPGSIRLSEGMPDNTSHYAEEGTAAHDLGERAIKKSLDCDVWLDTEINGITVTEEMCEAVQVYVDFVKRAVWHVDEERKVGVAGQLMLEQRFDLAPLNPPGPMYGTSDATVWHEQEKLLHVIDYKHGAGVAVDAVGNPQLRYYAIGAVLALNKKPERVRMTIVQPRASHPDGIIRSDELTFEELVEFKRELFRLAERTTEPDAPLNPGPWCKFCKAAPVCPALKAKAVEVAQSDFAPFSPPAPEALTVEELQVVLAAADELSAWLSSVQAHALNLLERGEEVPGWKLVPKRATRKWTDEERATEILRDAGLTEEDLYTKKFVSPAQAEKALKAAKIKPALLEQVVVKESSGPKLAPDTDPRPELPASAISDFDIPS